MSGHSKAIHQFLLIILAFSAISGAAISAAR
jgi:hypothetical protein